MPPLPNRTQPVPVRNQDDAVDALVRDIIGKVADKWLWAEEHYGTVQEARQAFAAARPARSS